MFVKEFGNNLSSSELNSQLERVYKWRLNLSEMNEADARSMLDRVSDKISNIRKSNQAHHAEKNPKFMESLIVSQVLESWLREHDTLVMERKLKKAEINRREKFVKGMKSKSDEFEKRYPGRGEEVMYATATKMAKNESIEEAMQILKSVLTGTVQLNESEVDQASAIVAARGMVDEIQKMVEKIGTMVNEELPGLYDTIRDRVGADQAQAFNNAAQTALTPLMDAVKAAREAMDNAARVVAGEQPMPMGDAGAAATAPTAELTDLDTGTLPEPPSSELDTSDAATGGTAELGRGKRV